jgi:hypothetical protein
MSGALYRKTKSFIGIPLSTTLLFAEAAITSAYVKTVLLFFPFSKVANWLGTFTAQPIDIAIAENNDLVKKIKFAVRLCTRYMPWPVECYTSSLTAKIMLKRRKLASILYFGFYKDEGGSLKGHAWLRCSEIIVTGFCDFSKYQVHSSFS